MRNFKKPLILLFSLIVILIIVGTSIYIKYVRAINDPLIGKGSTVSVVVKEGDSLYDVLNHLNDNKSLRSLYAAKYYIKKNNLGGEIQPGTYDILLGTNLDKIIKLLKEGGHNIRITIPEGLNIEEIADKVEKSSIATKEEFLDAVKNYPLPSYVKQDKDKRYQLEGYLFPDTYFFKKSDKANDVIIAMLYRFTQVMSEVQKETGVSIEQENYEKIINKASMIEKEARVDSDRPLISSVIDNRLNKNMKLQLDATVLYALGQHKDVVTLKDLETKSPYNTYLNKGLPVGPICSPGKPSILAALQPEKTDYLYYILKKDNKHYFTADYNDFLKVKKELGY